MEKCAAQVESYERLDIRYHSLLLQKCLARIFDRHLGVNRIVAPGIACAISPMSVLMTGRDLGVSARSPAVREQDDGCFRHRAPE